MRLFIFDVGGVIATNTNVVPFICDYLGISETQFFTLIERESLKNIQSGQLSVESFIAQLSAQIKKDVPKDIWEMFFKPIPIEGTIELIRQLKKKYRVVAGTNTIEPHYKVHLDRGDYDIFDRVYASHLIGLAKPDPAFYRHILVSENCPAEEAFFVDDTIKNVQAAEEVGIVAFRFTEPHILKERLEEYL